MRTGAFRQRLSVFVCLLLLIFMVIPAQAQEPNDLLGRVNGLRASRGLPAYSYNAALAAAAQSQAQWIVESRSVSHTRPDGSGPRTRAAAAGYPSAQVSENIYGGTNASAGDAWTFWVNSGVHYAGLVSTNYTEIGVGAARGSWGAAYVLVFGNPGGAALPVAAASGGGGGGNSSGRPAARPRASSAIGVDAQGNIQHMVQPGDTLGDIALLYGYTWSDLPAMMALNNMENVRDLVVGSIFLVPPAAGTYTPTPDDRTPTPSHTPTPIPPTITPFVLPTRTPPVITPVSISALATAPVSADAALELTPVFTPIPPSPTPSPTPTETPAAPPITPESASGIPPSTWLVAALVLQALIIVGAGIGYIRHGRTHPRTPSGRTKR